MVLSSTHFAPFMKTRNRDELTKTERRRQRPRQGTETRRQRSRQDTETRRQKDTERRRRKTRQTFT